MTEFPPPTGLEGDDPLPRAGWQLLRDRKFGGFFWARIVTSFALWAYNVVAAVLVFQLTGSATLVAIMAAAQAVPQFVLGPFMGGATDRGNAALLVVLGFLTTGAGMGGLGLWALLDPLTGVPGAWVVIASSFVAGVGFLVSGPAMMAMVTVMVRPDEIPAALALNAVPLTLARAVGPGLGGLGVATVGPEFVLLVAGAVNLVAGAYVAWLRLPTRLADPADVAGGPGGGSWQLFRERRQVRRILLGVTAVGIGADPAMTLTPAMAEALGAPTELAGVLTSSFGVGAVVGLTLLGVIRRRHGLSQGATLGLATMAAGLLVAACAPVVAVAMAGLFVAGVGMTIAFTKTTTLLQLSVPASARGRVMGLWMIAFVGSRPLGSSIAGVVTDLVDVHVACAVTAAGLVLLAWLARPTRTDPGRALDLAPA